MPVATKAKESSHTDKGTIYPNSQIEFGDSLAYSSSTRVRVSNDSPPSATLEAPLHSGSKGCERDFIFAVYASIHFIQSNILSRKMLL